MKRLLKGGRVIDPAQGLDGTFDVEIASEVADGSASVILDQVANGVAVRMAVLYLLAGGTDEADS